MPLGRGAETIEMEKNEGKKTDCGRADASFSILNGGKFCCKKHEPLMRKELEEMGIIAKKRGASPSSKITTPSEARRILKVWDCYTDEQLEMIIKQFGEITQENLDVMKPLARSLEKERGASPSSSKTGGV